MDRFLKIALSTVDMNAALQDMLTTQLPSLPFMNLDVDKTELVCLIEQDPLSGRHTRCKPTTYAAIPCFG